MSNCPHCGQATWIEGLGCEFGCHERAEMVNRIEELNKHCCELEADLEKAVSALEEVQDFVRGLEPYADQGHTLVPALQKACETLNELKGHGR